MGRQQATLFRCKDLPNKCFQFFAKMKNEMELCDITIHVGSISIAAHRLILSASIPYFRNIFSSKNEKKDITLPTIEPDVLECLIEYAYTCEVNINVDNVKNLLTASCYLSIEEVKDACCDFLADGLEPESAWSIRELAISLDCPSLLQNADCYLTRNFDIIRKTKDFLNYPWVYLSELIEKDDLNVSNEKQVLEAVLRWVKESPDDRKDVLPELLYKIRMPLVEPLYLRNIVRTEEIFQTSALCRNIIEDGKDYNLLPELREKQCCFKTQPRKNKNKIHNPIIYGLQAAETYSIECFDLLNKKLTRKKEKKIFLEGPAVYLENKIYLFHCSTTLQFDPLSNTFRKMNSMPTWREFTGITVLKNKIYFCGGLSADFLYVGLNVVECFDPAQDEWMTVTAMSTNRRNLNAVTLGEHIFTLDGMHFFTALKSVERYDSKRDMWTSMSSMLTARYDAGAATLNGKIYVCGGKTSIFGVTATSEVYDPIDDKWVFVSSMNCSRLKFTLLSCEEKLYAVGGFDIKENKVCHFDIYDPENDKWTTDFSTGDWDLSEIVTGMPSVCG